MSDRDIIERIFDILCNGFEGSEFSVSMVAHTIFLSVEDREWCLSLFTRADQKPS